MSKIVAVVFGGLTFALMLAYLVPIAAGIYAESGTSSGLTSVPGGSAFNDRLFLLFYGFGLVSILAIIMGLIFFRHRG